LAFKKGKLDEKRKAFVFFRRNACAIFAVQGKVFYNPGTGILHSEQNRKRLLTATGEHTSLSQESV
jgi:hypothetical protein